MKALLIALAGTGVLAAGCGTTTVGGTGSSAQSPVVTVTDDPSDPSGSSTATETGSPTPSTSPGTSPSSAGPSTAAAGGRCRTADLTASLHQLDAAAGNRYADVVLTNSSGHACTVFGYGGIQLATGTRRPIPTTQVRDRTHPPMTVRLAPGAQASSLLHWGVVPGTGEPEMGPCEPDPALLLVIAPDERTQLSARWAFGPVCQHGRIDQRAYVSGIATS